MVPITFNLIFPALFFAQAIQSYCIYNSLTDGSTFDVTQALSRVPDGRVFHKSMGPDAKECCPYTTADCAMRKINNDDAYFYFYFHWPRFSSERHMVKCTTGGALAIYGSENDHWAECTDRDGKTTRVAITPDAVRS